MIARYDPMLLHYDALNRVTNKHYLNYRDGANDVTYKYDQPTSSNPKGRLTEADDDTSGANMTQFFYDKQGRTTGVVRTIGGKEYSTGFAYDQLNHITQIVYPDSDQANYAYDGAGNVITVSNIASVPYAAFSNYNALGQVQQIAYQNGVNTTLKYDPATNRLNELSSTANGSPVQDFVYG